MSATSKTNTKTKTHTKTNTKTNTKTKTKTLTCIGGGIVPARGELRELKENRNSFQLI